MSGSAIGTASSKSWPTHDDPDGQDPPKKNQNFHNGQGHEKPKLSQWAGPVW
jgi:hypothetical protein